MDMATMADIARLCNTSSATVSYVLNGRGDKHKISEKMQEKIINCANELGYTKFKNPSTTTSNTRIAVCWPYKYVDTTISSVLIGMSNAMYDSLEAVDLILKPFPVDNLKSLEDIFTGKSADGVVIMAPGEGDIEFLSDNPSNIPVVFINRELENYSSVNFDNDEVCRLAVKHSIHKAGDDISLVLNPAPIHGFSHRSKTMIKMFEEEGIDVSNNTFYSNNSIKDGYNLGKAMIKSGRLSKIIICVYDMVALGIVNALNDSNIKIGKDVEIIATSTGMQSLFRYSSPSMTVVDLKLDEVAIKSVNLAISLATKRIVGPQTLTISPELIYRSSSPLNDY